MEKANMKYCTEMSKEDLKMKIAPDRVNELKIKLPNKLPDETQMLRNASKVHLLYMHGDLYVAYHRVLNSYHWIWEGKPLTSQHQRNMEEAQSRFEYMVIEWGEPEDLERYYRTIRIEVEDRKIGKIYPVASD